MKEDVLNMTVEYAYCQECYENIKRVLNEIQINKVIVLTGENGTGKSLVRKLMWSVLEKQIGHEVKITDTSMYRFMNNKTELIDSSGNNFIRYIKHWINWKDRYIVIDMPELGLSESYLLGIIKYLNDNMIPYIMNGNYGVMVITHSRTVVEKLNHDVFLNMENMSRDEWLTREVEPVSVLKLMKRNDALRKFMCAKLSEVDPDVEDSNSEDDYEEPPFKVVF